MKTFKNFTSNYFLALDLTLNFLELKYGFKVRDIMFMDDFMIFNLEGSCGIMSMSYSTLELKGTPHLNTVQLIRFMWNYGYEQ